MSMTQEQWSRRVAEIGAMAGWGEGNMKAFRDMPEDCGIFARLSAMAYGEPNPTVVTAIRQLAADWLASEGVVASRWRTGTPYAVAAGRAYWCLCEHGYTLCRFKDGKWTANTDGRRRQVTPLRWQELDGIDYEVSHE